MVKKGITLLTVLAVFGLLLMLASAAGAAVITVSIDSCSVHAFEPPYATVEVKGTVSQDGTGLAGTQVALAVYTSGGQFLAATQVSTDSNGQYNAFLPLAVGAIGVPAGPATVKVGAAGQTTQCQVEIPTLPSYYYGSVKDTEGNQVASGKVRAYIGGKKCGEIDFTNGFYSAQDINGLKLLVSGTEEDRTQPVTFKVEVGGNEWLASTNPASVIYLPGQIRQVDLTIPVSEQPPKIKIYKGALGTEPPVGLKPGDTVRVEIEINSSQSYDNALVVIRLDDPDQQPSLTAIQGPLPGNTVLVFSGSFTLPNKTGTYTANAFVWDGWEDMNPLFDSASLTFEVGP